MPEQPQEFFHSGMSRKDNVHDKFLYQDPEEIAGTSVLFVDDILLSIYTIREIGQYLTKIRA